MSESDLTTVGVVPLGQVNRIVAVTFWEVTVLTRSQEYWTNSVELPGTMADLGATIGATSWLYL